MIWRRVILLGILIVGLCAAFTVWYWHRCQHAVVFYSSSPVVPQPGNEAIVDLYIRNPNVELGHAAQKDYRKVTLRIRCMSANGQLCNFNVYETADGKPEKLGYSVAVNYATNDVAARSRVVDSCGRQISPDKKDINGDPIVLRYLLSFSDGYLEPYKPRDQGSEIMLKRLGAKGVKAWGIQMFRGDLPDGDVQVQWWTYGEWIWSGVDAWRWYAIRRSVTPH